MIATGIDRQILWKGAAACLLALTFVAGALVTRPPRTVPLVERRDVATADRVTIVSADENIDLRKETSGSWNLRIDGDQFPANSEEAQALLQAIGDTRVSRAVARNASDLESYGLGPTNRQAITLFSGTRETAIIQTGSPDAAGGLYARLGQNAAVFDVTAEISPFLDRAVSFWEDLKVLPAGVTVDALQSLSITARNLTIGGKSANGTYLLDAAVQNGATVWVAHGETGAPLDQKKVLSMQTEIVTMSADEIVTQAPADGEGFDRPSATIRLSTEQGNTYVLEVGVRKGAQFYVRRVGGLTYLVNEWSVSRAVPNLADLRQTPNGPS